MNFWVNYYIVANSKKLERYNLHICWITLDIVVSNVAINGDFHVISFYSALHVHQLMFAASFHYCFQKDTFYITFNHSYQLLKM